MLEVKVTVTLADEVLSLFERLMNGGIWPKESIKAGAGQGKVPGYKRKEAAERYQKALARTESAAFGSMARARAFKELGVKKYRIDATLDDRTSDICRSLDQTVFDMDDYEAGKTASPFHTNCRSTEVPLPGDGSAAPKQTAARGEDGDIQHVPCDMDYKEWYNKFVPKPKTIKLDEGRATVRTVGFSEDGEYKFIPSGADITDVTIIAGGGTATVHRAAERLAEQYGGDASEWLKMAGKVESRHRIFDVHWVENGNIGLEEMKTKKWKYK